MHKNVYPSDAQLWDVKLCDNIPMVIMLLLLTGDEGQFEFPTSAPRRRWSTESGDSTKPSKPPKQARRFSTYEAEGESCYTDTGLWLAFCYHSLPGHRQSAFRNINSKLIKKISKSRYTINTSEHLNVMWISFLDMY